MTTLALVPHRGLADSLAELFAEVDAEPIAALLAEYRDRADTLARMARTFTDPDTLACLPYFIEGNKANDRYSGTAVAESLFALPGALAALNADYWGRALRVTDVLECMPAARRDAWHKQIDAHDVPEFSEAALRSTLAEHLASRPRYFAERVDGIFRALSPEHVTNSPAGFRGKLILAGVFDGYGFSSSRAIDTLTDLRVIVARFRGRTDLGEGSYTVRRLTEHLINYARQQRRGEWVSVDGAAIEVKCHKSGTCHVRMHDELAWRLNAVLAYLHPNAIPESARTRQRGSVKQPKTVELVTRPLPFAVLRVLDEMLQFSTRNYSADVARGVWHHAHGWLDVDKHVRAEVDAVIESLGGGLIARNGVTGTDAYRFDFDATEVLRELVVSGCVPDQRAHQYYPTPRWLAERVVALAEIGPDDTVLEPSAGQGAIAELLPRDRTVCVEASALHCAVLRAKGFAVMSGDFLAVTAFDMLSKLVSMETAQAEVTRVVMNPPFDRGQWMRHVEHAAKMLAGRGARLVAVLPSGAPSKLTLPGFTLSWSEPIAGAFIGTNVSVVLLTAVKQG